MKSVQDFAAAKAAGRRISMVTCYDAALARVIEASKVDCILVGDSAAMVVHGYPDTLAATVEMMAVHTAAVHALIARVLAIQPTSAEAMFWQALCQVRDSQLDTALSTLDSAHQASGKQYIDPPFYAGILLHRQGRSQEALRLLAEANRVDPGCPLVAWQTGLALVEAGGDSIMALDPEMFRAA